MYLVYIILYYNYVFSVYYIIIILYYDSVLLSVACWRYGYFSRSILVIFFCFQSFGYRGRGGIFTNNTGFGFIARDTWRRHSSDGYDCAAAAVAVTKTTTATAFNLKAPKLLPLILFYNTTTLNYHPT